MPTLYLVLIIIAIVIGILSFIFKDKIDAFLKDENIKLPYNKKEFLLNIPERKFFEGLQKIISDKYYIFPQIPLGSIIYTTDKGTNHLSSRNKIDRKIVDFVLFTKPYITPVLVIEYDGKTHDEPTRKRRDNFVNNALISAGIKILHVHHKNDLDFAGIKNEIESLINNNH
jgi:hypothetical protein